jgi:hypothetical protein
VVGAVAVQVYDPSGWVVTVAMFMLQLNTHSIGSLPIPTPFETSLNLPETVNIVPCVGFKVEGVAVMLVWAGDGIEPDFKVNVMVPGPVNVTGVRSPDPPHDRPLVQAQLETE